MYRQFDGLTVRLTAKSRIMISGGLAAKAVTKDYCSYFLQTLEVPDLPSIRPIVRINYEARGVLLLPCVRDVIEVSDDGRLSALLKT